MSIAVGADDYCGSCEGSLYGNCVRGLFRNKTNGIYAIRFLIPVVHKTVMNVCRSPLNYLIRPIYKMGHLRFESCTCNASILIYVFECTAVTCLRKFQVVLRPISSKQSRRTLDIEQLSEELEVLHNVCGQNRFPRDVTVAFLPV